MMIVSSAFLVTLVPSGAAAQDTTLLLRLFPVHGVYILGAGILEYQRGTVGTEPQPRADVSCSRSLGDDPANPVYLKTVNYLGYLCLRSNAIQS
jgi:hypothetical protein